MKSPREFVRRGDRLETLLLQNLKKDLPQLGQLLDEINDHWVYEDGIYRFYHQSFKVFYLQGETERIVTALGAASPDGRELAKQFLEIIAAGTGREFKLEDNAHWVERTAPIVQAFLHARYFLEMAVKYAASLDNPPQPMPSGWAAVLCLYGLR